MLIYKYLIDFKGDFKIMINYMNRIAIKENGKRRQVLVDILKEMNCPFTIQYEKINETWVENIIVTFNKGLPKIILGAHYDAVDGSTGANDNGSGVCILLKMVEEYLRIPPTIPLEIIFFDGEELGCLGSKAYLNSVHNEDILTMINLDICGVGDTIVVGPAKNLENSLLGEALNEAEKLGNHKVELLKQLPSGDDRSFESKGISNISVCILDHPDIPTIEEVLALKKGDKIKNYPSILETMHNGPRDSIDVIDEKAMELLFNWTMDVIKAFK